MFGVGEEKRRTSDSLGQHETRIGSEARFDGELSGSSNYSIAGTVNGKCNIDGVVYIEESGAWEGEIQARVVIVAGTVVGNIIATEKLVLENSCVVRGKLSAVAIAIAEGAQYEGKIAMDVAQNITRFTEKRTPSE